MKYKVLVGIQDNDGVETSIKFSGKADEEQQLMVELLFSAVKAVDETLAVSGSLPASNSDWLQAVGPNNTEDWLQAIGASLKSHAVEMALDAWDGVNPTSECMQLLVNVEKLVGSKTEEEQEKLKAALTASTATLVEVDLPLFVEKEANKGQPVSRFDMGERVKYGVSFATVVNLVYTLNSWWYWLLSADFPSRYICVKEDQLLPTSSSGRPEDN